MQELIEEPQMPSELTGETGALLGAAFPEEMPSEERMRSDENRALMEMLRYVQARNQHRKEDTLAPKENIPSPSRDQTVAGGLDLENPALERGIERLVQELQSSTDRWDLGMPPGGYTEQTVKIPYQVRSGPFKDKFANIPLLVQGQVDVEDLLAGEEATEEQVKIAKARAQEREEQGEVIAAYDTIEAARAIAQRQRMGYLFHDTWDTGEDDERSMFHKLKYQRHMKPIADSAPIEEESIYPPGQAALPEMPPPSPGKMPPILGGRYADPVLYTEPHERRGAKSNRQKRRRDEDLWDLR